MGARCTRCGWPADQTRVLSTHPTSQGWTRYRRCVCGDVSIELVRLATETAAPAGALRVDAVHDVAGLPG